MRGRTTATVLAIAAAGLAWAGPATAASCVAAKLKAVGKLEAALLKCQAKVSSTNDSSGLTDCRNKATGKFTDAFAKAGPCIGVEASCNTNASDCESDVTAALTDTLPSKCEAAKLKAAAKLAKAEMTCVAKAATDDLAVDADCLQKAQTKFSTAMTKAGACPDGGMLQSLVESSCVDSEVTFAGVVTEVCPDKDECALGTDNCSADAACANTVGSFTCTCNPGYGGDGVTCNSLCGTDCWGELGCSTGAGRCVKFTCRAGSDGPTFCDSCLGWSEITYDQWMNQGYCSDVIQVYRATVGVDGQCGGAPTCCDGSANCDGFDNAWHFSDGVDTHFTGPCTGCVDDVDCSFWDSVDNSSYTRITACERIF